MSNKAKQCSTWNIRRGLLTREAELKNLLSSEKIDIMFLTETDTHNLTNEDSYVLQGYKTILPKIKCGENLVRIICLVKECILPFIKIRRDLMSEDFPSIWLEFQSDNKKKSTLISGFYRVWTIYGTGRMLASLNQRLFFIRRLKNHVGSAAILKICNGLFISKLRYGLQLLGSVRMQESDPLNRIWKLYKNV